MEGYVLKWVEEEEDDYEDLDPVMRCLKRSYNVLPMDLKRCFAYMAVFPEDHRIDGSNLVKLWMAEGFVSSLQRGRNVVRQLCDRCLLEVLPTYSDDCSGNPPIEIAKLPSLTALRLFSFESCSELPEEYGMSEGFSSLKHFVISQFPLLPQLPRIEEGAMRSLRTLLVLNCPNFNFNELPMELSTRLLSSEHVEEGWMWQLKSSMSTKVPLRSYYLDCGRHSSRGLWYRYRL